VNNAVYGELLTLGCGDMGHCRGVITEFLGGSHCAGLVGEPVEDMGHLIVAKHRGCSTRIIFRSRTQKGLSLACSIIITQTC